VQVLTVFLTQTGAIKLDRAILTLSAMKGSEQVLCAPGSTTKSEFPMVGGVHAANRCHHPLLQLRPFPP
jgi:hypothetical protein